MKIQRSIAEPIRSISTWEDRWGQVDEGLITCWEQGRDLGKCSPDLAIQARNGRLVLLNWKGGVEKAIKTKWKYGTFYYLAKWQGLRGEDLEIDTEEEPVLVCTLTGLKVIFTYDLAKYGKE